MVRHTHLVGRGSTGGRSVAHRVGARITDERKGVRGADHRHRDRPGAARRIVPSPTHSRSAIRRSWSTEGRVDDSSTSTAGPILILAPPQPWSDLAIATSECRLPWLPSSSAPPSVGSSRNQPAGGRVGRAADRPRARRPGEKGLVRTLQFGRQRGGHASPAATGRNRLVSFVGSWHGSHDGTMGLSAHPSLTGVIGRANVVKASYPDPYHPPFLGTTENLTDRCFHYLEHSVPDNL
jgi:hypothetical protein